MDEALAQQQAIQKDYERKHFLFRKRYRAASPAPDASPSSGSGAPPSFVNLLTTNPYARNTAENVQVVTIVNCLDPYYIKKN